MGARLTPSELNALILKLSKATLARLRGEQVLRTGKVEQLRLRLAREKDRLRRVETAIAQAENTIHRLNGKDASAIAPKIDFRRVTTLPHGVLRATARDIFRESDGRWMLPEDVGREIFARYDISDPSDEMVLAGREAAAAIARQLTAAGKAEHDGAKRHRRWRRIGQGD